MTPCRAMMWTSLCWVKPNCASDIPTTLPAGGTFRVRTATCLAFSKVPVPPVPATYTSEPAMKVITLVMGLCGVVALADICHAQIFDDPFAQYAARTITIWPGAGNANNANAAIHAIDPWPP